MFDWNCCVFFKAVFPLTGHVLLLLFLVVVVVVVVVVSAGYYSLPQHPILTLEHPLLMVFPLHTLPSVCQHSYCSVYPFISFAFAYHIQMKEHAER